MFFSKLKDFFDDLRYEKLYPSLNLLWGALKGKPSVWGKDVKIGRGTILFGSQMGDHISILDGCRIINTKMEDYVSIRQSCRLKEAQVGAFSYISRESVIVMTQVGRFCSVGPYLICGWGGHPTSFVSTSPVFYSTRGQCGISFADRDYYDEKRTTTIGNDVWIGARVFIKDGINVGNGAIIGAGAVVVKDVPDYAIVAGCPARVIRFRFNEQIRSKLLQIAWWNWDEDRLRNSQMMFAQSDVGMFIDLVE